MGLELSYYEGQTPLDEDEKDGLLISTVNTRRELDEFEQLGIEEAHQWIFQQRLSPDKILTEKFIRELHHKMFSAVWKWAGEFRTTNKNIGVDKYQIPIEIRNLLEDCKYWIRTECFSEDEIAVRFGHRMVFIHPFPNGNGRHSRLISDILVNKGFGQPYFTWGNSNLASVGEARSEYLKALKAADVLDYSLLIKFARS